MSEEPPREYPAYPIPGVGALITDGKRVLLVKRGAEPGKGLWALPGGCPRVGERLEEALVREVKEETGLEVRPKRVVGVFDVIVRDERGKVKYHYVLIDFEVEVIGGSLRPGGDAVEVRWFTPEELSKIPLSRTTRKLLSMLGFIKS